MRLSWENGNNGHAFPSERVSSLYCALSVLSQRNWREYDSNYLLWGRASCWKIWPTPIHFRMKIWTNTVWMWWQMWGWTVIFEWSNGTVRTLFFVRKETGRSDADLPFHSSLDSMKLLFCRSSPSKTNIFLLRHSDHWTQVVQGQAETEGNHFEEALSLPILERFFQNWKLNI